jgi:hypothetical protein
LAIQKSLPEAEAPLEEPATTTEDASVERLLAHVESPAAVTMGETPKPPAQPVPPVAPGLRSARVVSMPGTTIEITWRGQRDPVPAVLDEGVDRALIARAMAAGDAALVEVDASGQAVIVGVIQRRLPETVELKADKIVLDAEQEVTIRAGRAALRLREDGDVELVGSRISTLSRGLYRIVGRVLRLN